MTRKMQPDIVAGLMLASSVLLAALVARLGAGSAWALTAPLVLGRRRGPQGCRAS